jgi:uncharacterized protein YqjF (DUF2071 family)
VDVEAPQPPPVTTAMMIQQWRWMTFMHRPYAPEVIQPLLPAGLSVQTFDGAAWMGLVAVHAQHPPWPLRHAHLLELRQDVVQAAGLPAPGDPPVVHASNGVTVRIGLPCLVPVRRRPR